MEAGSVIARKYRLTRRIAEGGMAEVWAARNERTRKDVAIKFLLEKLGDHEQALERFRREASATGRLDDENVIDVFDAGQTPEGRPFLVMELLRGETLEERLTREGRLSQLDTAALLGQVASGLAAAHRARIVHRDLSSANVFLVARSGGIALAKIIDFGVSKLLEPQLGQRAITVAGSLVGSPAFMSPEQARGAEAVGERSDLWALGVLAYNCLTGQLPFHGRSYSAMMLAIVSAPHRPLKDVVPDVDPELADVIESCLVKDEEARTTTAAQICEDLKRISWRLAREQEDFRHAPRRRVTDKLDLAPPRRADPRLDRYASGLKPWGIRAWQRLLNDRRPRTAVALGGVVVGTLFGVAVGAVVSSYRDKPPAPRYTIVVPPAPPPAPPDPLEPGGTSLVPPRVTPLARSQRLPGLPAEAGSPAEPGSTVVTDSTTATEPVTTPRRSSVTPELRKEDLAGAVARSLER